MVAGGLTFAVPGVMPAAYAANANLFVSAENSQFDNYMSGPQVIEVVVIDSDINDTDEAKGEPDVTVNGKILRMAQGVDGNWYGYFADRDQALIADSTATTEGSGLDFGGFCSAASGETVLGVDVSDTDGIALANQSRAASDDTDGSSTGGEISATCTVAAQAGTGGTAEDENNVLREYKDLVNNTSVSYGQIGVLQNTAGDAWPFIQLYELNPTGNVVVQYNKGGGVQSTTLTFDTVDHFADLTLDRSVYPRLAQVHATITDLWLNIDPTDEDSWTFTTNVDNSTSIDTFYQVFDENGQSGGTALSLSDTLGSLMCEDNCVLQLNIDAQSSGTNVVTIQDNGDTVLIPKATGNDTNDADAFQVSGDTTGLVGRNSIPVTVTEQGPNSGVFGTYDESDVSVLKITSNALRGTSASLDYNETPQTILVGFDFASIDIQPIDDEWSSGEEIPVIIVDGDQNKNSRADEDLDLNNENVTLIPSLRTGNPITLAENNSTDGAILHAVVLNRTHDVGTLFIDDNANTGVFRLGNSTHASGNATATIEVDAFSKRGILEASSALAAGEEAIIIDLNMTGADLKATVQDTRDDATTKLFGANLFNQDFRGLNSTATYDVYLIFTTEGLILTPYTTTMAYDSDVKGISIVNASTAQSLTLLNGTTTYDTIVDAISNIGDSNSVGLVISNSADFGSGDLGLDTDENAFVADFFSFGFTDDGVQSSERVANQIVRIEAEETGDNTSTFEGSLEYIMVNQLNILDTTVYTGISPIADDPSFIVIEDLTDEDAPRVNYNDLGADGVVTPVSDQEEAPSHSGVVSLNQDSYKIADTVVITLEDLDLNVDSDLIDIFTVVEDVGDDDNDVVGSDVDTTLENLSFGSDRKSTV